MVRFLWAVRKAYNTKRIAFVIAFGAVAVFLYFAPYAVFPQGISPLKYSLFGHLLDFKETLELTRLHNLPIFDVVFIRVLSIVLFLTAVTGCAIISESKLAILSALPLPALGIYVAVSGHIVDTYAIAGYKAFYIIVCLLVILAVALILLAVYLPLKEPAPRPEHPKRERKPTKDERIAELERQVAVLREKDERIAELERQVAALRGKEKDET